MSKKNKANSLTVSGSTGKRGRKPSLPAGSKELDFVVREYQGGTNGRVVAARFAERFPGKTISYLTILHTLVREGVPVRPQGRRLGQREGFKALAQGIHKVADGHWVAVAASGFYETTSEERAQKIRKEGGVPKGWTLNADRRYAPDGEAVKAKAPAKAKAASEAVATEMSAPVTTEAPAMEAPVTSEAPVIA